MNTRTVLVTVFVAALFVVGSPQSATAQWYRTYEEAKQALATATRSGKSADLQRAESLFKQAAGEAERAGVEPGRNVQTYGMRFVHFMPEYYLGVVYSRMGRPGDARAAFQSAKDSGASSKDAEFRDLESQMEIAATEVAKLEDAQSVTDQRRIEDRRAASGQSVPAPPADTPPARRDPDTFKAPPAQQQEQTSVAVQQQPPPAQPELTPPEAKALDYQAPAPATLRQVPNLVGLDVKAAERRLAESQLTAGPRNAQESVRVREGLVLAQSPAAGTRVRTNTAVAIYYAAAPRMTAASDPEQVAVLAFFAGNYEDAIQTLSPMAARRDAPARVHFYLACAAAAQSILSPAAGARLLDNARAQYRLALAGGDRLARDRRYISPRILALLEPQRPGS